MRWADLDLLGHVNNVQYVDYLQEARGAMIRACLHAAGVERQEGVGLVVVRHEVTFVAPLLFRTATVAIDTWVSDLRAASFTLDHEIYQENEDGDRVVYLRARTVLAPFEIDTGLPRRVTDVERQALAPYAEPGVRRVLPVRTTVPRAAAHHYSVAVRFSDIDVYRHVNNVKYVEYFQEGRIAAFAHLRRAVRDFPRLHVVVAQTDIEYVSPMVLRAEPYDCWSAVTRMGNRSMTIESEIVDAADPAGERVLARSRTALVFFDPATQRSVVPPPGYREAIIDVLGGELPA